MRSQTSLRTNLSLASCKLKTRFYSHKILVANRCFSTCVWNASKSTYEASFLSQTSTLVDQHVDAILCWWNHHQWQYLQAYNPTKLLYKDYNTCTLLPQQEIPSPTSTHHWQSVKQTLDHLTSQSASNSTLNMNMSHIPQNQYMTHISHRTHIPNANNLTFFMITHLYYSKVPSAYI